MDVDAVDPPRDLDAVRSEPQRRQLAVAVAAEGHLETAGLELAARLRLAAQVAQQVELEPADGRAEPR